MLWFWQLCLGGKLCSREGKRYLNSVVEGIWVQILALLLVRFVILITSYITLLSGSLFIYKMRPIK